MKSFFTSFALILRHHARHSFAGAIMLGALALASYTPGAHAEGELSPDQRRLVLQATALGVELYTADQKSMQAKALLTFAHNLDPHYATAGDALDAIEAGEMPAPSTLETKREDFVKLLLKSAADEKKETLSLLYYSMSLFFETDNAEARAALIAAQKRGVDTSLGNLLNDNEQEFLTESVPYGSLLRPLCEQATTDDLEGAPLDQRDLKDLADRFKRRAKADEADSRTAKEALSLLGLLASLDAKRAEILPRLARAKAYEPPVASASRAVYENDKATGRARQVANVDREWKQALEKQSSSIERSLSRIVKAEKDLQAKFGKTSTVASNKAPERNPTPPTTTTTPPDSKTNETFAPNATGNRDFTTKVAESNVKFNGDSVRTPDHLKNQVLVIANWLENQRARTGKLVNRIFAADENGRVILYLEVSELFLKQDADTRFAVTKSIQEMWARRCTTDEKCNSLDGAFLVTIDDKQNVVGGSSEKHGLEIWVKKL